MTIRVAESNDELDRCFPVMRELRPLLEADSFVSRVRSQEDKGYRIAYIEHGAQVVAVAGFRIIETLVDGRFLYVDDLVTRDSSRSKGHGGALFSWLCERAAAEDCRSIQLDSGHQRRHAHRFYQREGMENSGLHFKRRLRETIA